MKTYRFVFYVLCVVAVVVSVGVGCRIVVRDDGTGGGTGGGGTGGGTGDGGTSQGCTIFDAPCDQGPELVLYSENAAGEGEWPSTIMDFFGGYEESIEFESSVATGGADGTTTFLILTPTDAQPWAAGGWSRQAGVTQTLDVSLYDTLTFSYRIVGGIRLGLGMQMESGTAGECQNVPIALNKDDTWREVTLGLKQFTNPVLYGGGRNGFDRGRGDANCSLDVDLTDVSALLVYNLLDTGDGDTSTVDKEDGSIHLDEIQLVMSGDTTAPAAVGLDPGSGVPPARGDIDIRIIPPTDPDLDGYRVTYMLGRGFPSVPPNCDDGAPNLRFISSADARSNVLSITGLTPMDIYGFRICSEDLTGNYSNDGLFLTNVAVGE